MDNYYAWLETHILADEAALQKALRRAAQKQSLNLAQLQTVRQVLFDPQRKQAYDRLLQAQYPELLAAAEAELAAEQARAGKVRHRKQAARRQRSMYWAGCLLVAAALAAAAVYGIRGKKQTTDGHSAFTDAFKQTWQARTVSKMAFDYDEARGLLLLNTLEVLANSKQPEDHAYREQMERVRRYYGHDSESETAVQSIRVYKQAEPLAWLQNGGMLVGKDVWRAEGLRPVYSFEEEGYSLRNVMPGGRYALAVNHQTDDVRVKVFDTATGKTGNEFILTDTNGKALKQYSNKLKFYYSPDGRYMLVTFLKNDYVYYIGTQTDGQITGFRPVGDVGQRADKEHEWLLDAVFADNYLNIVYESGSLRRYRLSDLHQESDIAVAGQNAGLYRADFSRNGKRLWFIKKDDTYVGLYLHDMVKGDNRLLGYIPLSMDSERSALGAQALWFNRGEGGVPTIYGEQ